MPFQVRCALTVMNKELSIQFGNSFKSVLEINGGENSFWNLESNLKVDSLIIINGGGLNTNGFSVNTVQFFVFGISPTVLDFSSSEIVISGQIKLEERDYYRSYPVFGMITDNVTLNAGTSTMRFTSRFPSLRIYGNKEVQFNNLAFTSPFGLSFINYLREFRWEYFYFNGESSRIRSNNVTIRNNALIFSEHMINELELSPAKSYKFESGKTLIIQNLISQGSCGEPITISSIRPIGQTSFQFNQSQEINFTNLRNIHATGTGNFMANNSVDLGNNIGWNIQERVGSTLYWVGGKGRWTDPMHWATSSGGDWWWMYPVSFG